MNGIAQAHQAYKDQQSPQNGANGFKPISSSQVYKASRPTSNSQSKHGFGAGPAYEGVSNGYKNGGQRSSSQQSYQLPPPPVASRRSPKMTMYHAQMPQQQSYASSFNDNQSGYEDNGAGHNQQPLQAYDSSLVSYKVPSRLRLIKHY